jgi:hypothetical protein
MAWANKVEGLVDFTVRGWFESTRAHTSSLRCKRFQAIATWYCAGILLKSVEQDDEIAGALVEHAIAGLGETGPHLGLKA